MKLNIKKVATVLGSALMLGATVGAASFTPSSFTDGGIAIVVGANAANSDLKAAVDLTSNLAGDLAAQTGMSSSVTVTGGDSVTLSRPSSLLHVGESLASSFGKSITSNEMSNLLVDGTYRDSGNNDNDYTQKIDVANLTLQQFDASGYNLASDTTPVIGIPVASGNNILNYSLSFTTAVNASLMPFTTINMMGKQYYVLSASTSQLVLLDSGVSASLGGSDTKTLVVGNTSYDISVAYIDSNDKVKLTVNGETTDTLSKGDTYKLTSGAYIGIKDILAQNYAGGISQVDFSIGSGKLTLASGSTVQLNKDSVNGVTSVINSPSTGMIDKITIKWAAGKDTAITTDGLTFPTFSGVKLSSSGMVYPTSETTTVKNDGNTGVQVQLADTNGQINLDILGLDKTTGNFTSIGKDSNHLLQTSSSASSINFNANGVNSSAMFVVSWNDSKDSESYVYKVQNFVNSSGVLKVDLVSQDGGKDITLTNGTSSNIGSGNVALTPIINYSANTVNLTANGGSGTVGFDHIFTKEGLMINLPQFVTSAAGNNTIYNTTGANTFDVGTYVLVMQERDKDGNVGAGSSFNMSVGSVGKSGSYQTSVTAINGAGSGIEQQSSNVYQYTVSSKLASTILYDQGPTQETATITYHGGESYDSILLTAAGATITSGTSTVKSVGTQTVYDNEVSSVSGKNLIVIGGSCVNSVAAELLGGAACDAAFTAKTSVKAGEAIIKPFARSGKIALLVAGYNAADTTTAITYLSNKAVNTTVGSTGIKVVDANTATAITA